MIIFDLSWLNHYSGNFLLKNINNVDNQPKVYDKYRNF